jgi:hypothetical protein
MLSITGQPKRKDMTTLSAVRCLHCITLLSLVPWIAPAAAAPSPVTGNEVSRSESAPPCGLASGEQPSPAYPLPAYTMPHMLSLFRQPHDVMQLLYNLQIVYDRNLLAQPSFFNDAVLLKLFDGTGIRWGTLSTPGVAFSRANQHTPTVSSDVVYDKLISPDRVGRISMRPGPLSGMRVEVGLSHKCLNRHPDSRQEGTFVAAHTYDSGYLRLRFEPMDGFTLGSVRTVFGRDNYRSVDCAEPPPVSFSKQNAVDSSMFDENLIEFELDPGRHQQLCISNARRELPDEYLVKGISIRLIEADYSRIPPITP